MNVVGAEDSSAVIWRGVERERHFFERLQRHLGALEFEAEGGGVDSGAGEEFKILQRPDVHPGSVQKDV